MYISHSSSGFVVTPASRNLYPLSEEKPPADAMAQKLRDEPRRWKLQLYPGGSCSFALVKGFWHRIRGRIRHRRS